jgi:hypothetical protein
VRITLTPVPTATETFVLAVIRDATEPRRRDDLVHLAGSAAACQARMAGERSTG